MQNQAEGQGNRKTSSTTTIEWFRMRLRVLPGAWKYCYKNIDIFTAPIGTFITLAACKLTLMATATCLASLCDPQLKICSRTP